MGKAFGATAGGKANAHVEPAREGKGAKSESEAAKGQIDKGQNPKGIKGTGNGFGV